MPARLNGWTVIAAAAASVLLVGMLVLHRDPAVPERDPGSAGEAPRSTDTVTSTDVEEPISAGASARADLASHSAKRVKVIAHCAHHEFELPDVPIEVDIDDEQGECVRKVKLLSGADAPALGRGESLGDLRPLLPEPDWGGSGRWVRQPRGAPPKVELEAALSVCLDLRLPKGMDVPGTIQSSLCARTGRKEATSRARWYAALGPDRFLLPCPDHERPAPSCATIARTDGTAFGVTNLSPQPGNQLVEHVVWSAVGAIHCNLGAGSVGVPCTIEWSRGEEPAQREIIAESSGSTIVRWLEPGECTITAFGPGRRTVTHRSTVLACRLVDLDLILEPDSDIRTVTCSLRMESGEALPPYTSARLTDLEHPDVSYDFEWTDSEPVERTLDKLLSLSRGKLYKLAISTGNVAWSGSPAEIGPRTEKVEFLGLDGTGTARPRILLVDASEHPIARPWRWQFLTKGSGDSEVGGSEAANGQLPSMSPSDSLCLNIYSTEREFDPIVLAGSEIARLDPGSAAEPKRICVVKPPTSFLLRLVDHDEAGIGQLEVILDTGTRLRTDAWGFVSVLAAEKVGTIRCPGYVFADCDDGPCPVLDLGPLASGGWTYCEILPAPAEPK
jgi:hypothetical protein